ncbi:DUF3224 domain-containing protein [Rheinheimera sp. WS51]|uniref:DUF3224 domain-containing protein n=1 Tax=Rheinheimera sp. WS51 TaxID=3425886 RepID=UPI003D93AB20
MKHLLSTILLIFIFTASSLSAASDTTQKERSMSASGTFEVDLEPQNDQEFPAGRMVIRKKYSGDLEGSGIGQMISKRTEGGASVYSAIEEFEGTVEGKSGSFSLFHNGYMSAERQSLEVIIVQGSGKGELESISGSLEIVQEEGKHKYVLTYEL